MVFGWIFCGICGDVRNVCWWVLGNGSRSWWWCFYYMVDWTMLFPAFYCYWFCLVCCWRVSISVWCCSLESFFVRCFWLVEDSLVGWMVRAVVSRWISAIFRDFGELLMTVITFWYIFIFYKIFIGRKTVFF